LQTRELWWKSWRHQKRTRKSWGVCALVVSSRGPFPCRHPDGPGPPTRTDREAHLTAYQEDPPAIVRPEGAGGEHRPARRSPHRTCLPTRSALYRHQYSHRRTEYSPYKYLSSSVNFRKKGKITTPLANLVFVSELSIK